MRTIVGFAVLWTLIAPHEAGAWLKQEVTSKVDGTSRVYISRITLDRVQDRFGQHVVPELVIACDRGESRTYINWQMMMDGYQGLTVTYRIGEAKAKTRWMSRSSDYQATGYWGTAAIGFTREMIGKKKLFVRAPTTLVT